MATARSKPMPVSTWRWGSGVNEPSGFALNWMKTRFQISMQPGSSLFTSVPRVSPSDVRSTCTSEHGPHGPVSPIIQKLSRSEEHTSELQSRGHLVCRLLLEKKKYTK